MSRDRAALLRELADELEARSYVEARPKRRRVAVKSPPKFRVQPTELHLARADRILRAKGVIP